MKNWTCLLPALALVLQLQTAAAPAITRLPRPLPDHPGNVFLAGEEVSIPAPAATAARWELLDYEDSPCTQVTPQAGRFNLGRLPTGFYRLQPSGATDWIALAVIAPLTAPVPKDSPIALDVAMAWFYPKDKMEAAANLCTIAGVNRVRDRLGWQELEPERGRFAPATRYDDSAAYQSRAGLQVLQVAHQSPSWASSLTARFPPDLRDVYRFYREMARRWRGQVAAFEPWNEADIRDFGGHTGAEMAALQKAAYLGIKAGAPETVACLNVFANHNPAQLADLQTNEAWPYFDTFNLHHYAKLADYPKLYADFRAVSAGRPLWVSECAIPVKWSGEKDLQEPTLANSRLLAERVGKVFASSILEGSAATFYFLLPHYVEGQTQFGLLRRDLTPRPGYVALAAAGRLLAGAKAIGRVNFPTNALWAAWFAAKPDGIRADVLVAWAAASNATLKLPMMPRSVFDHLGRARPRGQTLELTTAPVYVVFPPRGHQQFALLPLPQPPPQFRAKPSPIVLQALLPPERISLTQSAFFLSTAKVEAVPVYLYNFGDRPAAGSLEAVASKGWRIDGLRRVELPPHSRQELIVQVDARDAARPRGIDVLRLVGHFGRGGEPVVSLRFIHGPGQATLAAGIPIPEAADQAAWQPQISGDGPMASETRNGAVWFSGQPAEPDRWVYPRFALPESRRAPPHGTGLACQLTLREGQGRFRVIFEEANGSSYVADIEPPAQLGETVNAAAWFDTATHGDAWSPDDPNHHLDPDQIVAVKIGCNAKSPRVVYEVKDLRWLTAPWAARLETH